MNTALDLPVNGSVSCLIKLIQWSYYLEQS